MTGVIEQLRGEVKELAVKHGVRRLAVFGSALTPRFDPASSDIDFLVEFRTMPPAKRADAYFGLLEDLERLFGRPVDLVELSALRNPYIRQAVEASRVVLYEAA